MYIYTINEVDNRRKDVGAWMHHACLPGLYKIKVNINKTFVLYLHLGP
jgi:hypothetical protein